MERSPLEEYPAFCAALLMMEMDEAEDHLFSCFITKGEAAYALAKFYNEYRPRELLQKLKQDQSKLEMERFKEVE